MSPPSPPNQYPQAIQLKLYQAFIFSIPILFSIILFLLFYLFYLKRRASTVSSSTPPVLPRTIGDASSIASTCDLDLKNDQLKNKLCEILFDDYMKARDSLCCVCLGDFEVKEELLQVPTCKHMFHIDCIRHWLHNNSTCPLCRAPVVTDCYNSKSRQPHPHPVTFSSPETSESHRSQVAAPPSQILQLRSEGSSSGGGNTC